MPRISLVMPALNAEATLRQSFDSLAKQTMTDFDIILVNDGSSDSTQMIAESYQEKLNIKIFNHDTPQGVADSINDGIKASDSEFIARLDADDLAQPQRLEKQLNFMSNHSKIGVCGSDMLLFNDNDQQQYLLAHPQSNAAIRTALIQRCAISHPSVMCRRQVFEQIGYYDNRFDFAEDYELWCRASLLGIKFANIPEVLTLYRKHEGQVGKQKAQLQYERDIAIKIRYISAWIDVDEIGLLPHFLGLQTQFPSKDVAMTALQQIAPLILRLAKTVPDFDEFSSIFSNSLSRHLK